MVDVVILKDGLIGAWMNLNIEILMMGFVKMEKSKLKVEGSDRNGKI